MSFPCSGCIELNRVVVKSVKRKTELCATCRDMATRLPAEVPIDKTRLDSATIEDIADGSLRLLSATQTRLERMMLSGKNFNPVHASEAVRLSRAVAVAIKEARALRETTFKGIDDASDEEMRDIMVAWYRTLPPEHKKTMLQEMVAIYRSGKTTPEAKEEVIDGQD